MQAKKSTKRLLELLELASNPAGRKSQIYIEIAEHYRSLSSDADETAWLLRAYSNIKRRKRLKADNYRIPFRLFELHKVYGIKGIPARLKGLEFIREAKRVAKALDLTEEFLFSLHYEIGLLLSLIGHDELNLNRAGQIIEQLKTEIKGSVQERGILYLALGNEAIYQKIMGNNQLALRLFDDCFQTIPIYADSDDRASILRSYAAAEYSINANLQGAKKLLQDAGKLSSKNYLRKIILSDLEEICVELGDFRTAYNVSKEKNKVEVEWNIEKLESIQSVVKLRDQISDSKRKKEVAEIENGRLAEALRIVDEKNQKISQSLHYALTLQSAILPSENTLKSAFKDHFIFYRPKDIVAGDFYWFQKTANYYYFAVADCTGHGVPGAMVSMICHNALTESVQKLNEPDTNTILENARSLVKLFFNSDSNNIKDGMDIAIIRFGITDRSQVQFSGAHNPLLQLKKNGELLVHKGDRQPVGSWVKEVPFTAVTLELEPTDVIYLHSDGYPDQFGGPEATKLKTKGFRQLLTETRSDQLEVQHKAIERFFTDWCANEEQMDDVTLAGFRICQ
jgi:serine phosphatase RsbU (regulator of sigma subunit)